MPHFQPSPPPQDQVVRSDLSQDEWEEIQPPRLTVPTQSYVDEMTSPEDSTFVHSHQYSRGHSHCDSTQRQTRSPSPRSSNARMSPTPHGKRSMEKKPALACLFCRGRKIACGPPLPGSKDKTCNQCARRQLKCEYPLESRRGMRKRRSLVPRASSAAPEINPDGPKVTIKSNRKRAVEKRPR
ncbi:hypothetical protein F5I97DRAFT_1935371 [Phlebopus sp. FC_14]|nr:hypothetical protein F5I97DRAFT_1935371 [Phlebopus sp. FC_14]